jgi:hypothetical protein
MLLEGKEIKDGGMATGYPVFGWEGARDRTGVCIQFHYTTGRFSLRSARMLPLVFTPDEARSLAARLVSLADASEHELVVG